MKNSKFKTQSSKLRLKSQEPLVLRHSFAPYPLRFEPKRGIALLLVVVLLSALLSISLGIFNVVFGQLKISGEISDSFVAFYAADQGIEKTLYRDRIQGELCTIAPGPNCFVETNIDVQSGGCYTLRLSRVSSSTEIITSGQYRCGANPNRVVKRGFQVDY